MKHVGPFPWGWGAARGWSSRLLHVHQWLGVGVLAGGTFWPRCPQVNALRIRHWGRLLVEGSGAPVQGGDDRPVGGNPILSPRTPLLPGPAGWLVFLLFGSNAWCLFIARQ